MGTSPPSSTGNFSNHLFGVSAAIAEESFSRALASAIGHNTAMSGSAGQGAKVPGEESPQRSIATIVAVTHGVGDKAADADFRAAAQIARWIADSPIFSLAATTSGHIQREDRPEVRQP